MITSLSIPLPLAAADGLSRVIFESWHIWAPIVAFVSTFTFFVYLVYRAVKMRPKDRDYAASLPLETENQPADSSHLP